MAVTATGPIRGALGVDEKAAACIEGMRSRFKPWGGVGGMTARRCEQSGWHGGRHHLPQDESKCVQSGSELGLPCPTEKGRGLRTIEGIVPVELKPSNKPPARGGVYPNHTIQNLAYCVLVEEQLEAKVPLWPRHLRGPAGPAGGVDNGESRMADAYDRRGEGCTAGKGSETKSHPTWALHRMRCPSPLRSGPFLIVSAFQIFTAFVRFMFALALTGSKQFRVLRRKHIFFKEPHPVR